MQRLFLVIISVFLLFHMASTQTHAKTLPQIKGKPTKYSAPQGITVYPRIKANRSGVLVNFGNLSSATSVSYALIYTTNGQEESAGGAIDTNGISSASRDLFFGTCSKNVCRPHTNITKARLEVTSKLKSGKTSLKRYRIRV